MVAKSPFVLRKFPMGQMAIFADAVEMALSQATISLDTPGHIAIESRDRGGQYAIWSRLSAGKPIRTYVGAKGSEAHEMALAQLAELKQLQAHAKTLRKLGFEAVEHDAALVIAKLSNAGIFTGGGLLIGARAFGSILNHLGYKATPFLSTQDVDIARLNAINLAGPLATGGFVELLKNTGLRFLEVPGLDRPPGPATSSKVVGKDLKVDLLAPAPPKSTPYSTVPIRELGAHATTLPYLDFLIAESWTTIVIGRDHLIPVRCPQPARYCLHKLAVANLRSGAENPKIEKDIAQASILAAILSEEDAGALESAAAAATPAMIRHMKKSLAKMAPMLAEYPAALDFMNHVAFG